MRHPAPTSRSLPALVLVSCVLALGGCGETEPSLPNLLGKWVGTYTDGEGTAYDYTLFFNADGTMGAIAGLGDTPTGSGTWTLAGAVVDGSYTYESGQQFTIRGSISADGERIDGTYGPGIYPLGLGEFTVQRE